ncbi:MAG TPA: tetratricopeptide repeat protein [Gemmatimonadales bacterium]|nr:tetratricopeptide repeat protein [Gemmatimonadales bacterium]
MTAGLPGTGIGGMFYLISALATPLREGYLRMRGRRSRGWRLVVAQTPIAGAILAGMWATGWLLGLAVRASHRVFPSAGTLHPSNLLPAVALLISVGTLAFVLLGVELLRLWVRRRPDREATIDHHQNRRAVAAGERRSRILPLVLGAVVAAHAHPAAAQGRTLTTGHLGRADSAFTAGDARAAAQEYAAVLAADPWNSHATYRLAQLHRHDPRLALRLFRRYVALEPSDPWGYMAVGEALARTGRYGEALRYYDDALRLGPGERDAVVGRARTLVRARRTGAAIAAYGGWLAAHATDAEVRRELAAARVAAAPAIKPLVGGSRDSDGNATLRLGGVAELAASGPTRLGVAASRTQVRNGVTTIGLEELTLRASARPWSALQIDAEGGATRVDALRGAGATMTPTGQLRARWRDPLGGPAVDLRARRNAIDASPLLVTNRVVRTEIGAIVELPVARGLKLRGIGRTAALTSSFDVNHRTTLAGVVAVAVTPSVEVSAQMHEIRHSRPSSAGYFAPRLIQIAQAGSYIELETARSIVFAFDLGIGAQRAAQQGAAVGPWRRALRLYSLIAVPLAPGRELRFELDGDDSGVAMESATTAQWRYVSMQLSLRVALP